jgi:hypothetical protein
VDKSFVVDCDAMLSRRGNGIFEIDGIPKDDGSDNQVENTRPVALVLETAVTQVTLSIGENGENEGISSLALIESDLDSSTQLMVFHPLQHEECAVNAADFAQRSVEAVLAGTAGELTDDERSSHSPCRMDAVGLRISSHCVRTSLTLSLPPIRGASVGWSHSLPGT